MRFYQLCLLCGFLTFVFVPYEGAAYTRSEEVHLKPPKPKPRWSRPTTLIENLLWDIAVKNAIYDAYLLQFRDKNIQVDSPKDKKLVEKMNKILRRLKPNVLLQDLPMDVHLIDDPYVNAGCLPGGGILFFKGIFDREKGLINANDDDEIAAVMAHEMAHATLRHSYRQYKNARSIVMIGEMAGAMVGGTFGRDFSDLFQAVYYVPLGLYLLKFSREEESQADLEGLYMMMKTGYNPEKMIAIWERAAKKKGKKDKHSIFDDHPTSGKRARDLAKHLKNIRCHGEAKGAMVTCPP